MSRPTLSVVVFAIGLFGLVAPLSAQSEEPTAPQPSAPTLPETPPAASPEPQPTSPVDLPADAAAPVMESTPESTIEPALSPPAPAPAATLEPPAHTAPAISDSDRQPLASSGARIELSLLALPLGAGAGNILCGITECRSARAWAAANLFGAGGAAALAALSTRKRPLRFSTAQAIEGGAIWGMTTSVYFTVLGITDSVDKNVFLTSMLVGELVGATAGALLEREFRPTSGAVALANSGALWLPSMTSLLAATSGFRSEAGVRAFGASMFVAQALGLGLGGLLGQRDGATRGQVFLADAGAIVGGGMLPLLAWLMVGELTPESGFVTTAAGMALGFTTAYLLATRIPRARTAGARLDGPKRASLSITPTQGGGMVMLGGRL